MVDVVGWGRLDERVESEWEGWRGVAADGQWRF